MRGSPWMAAAVAASMLAVTPRAHAEAPTASASTSGEDDDGGTSIPGVVLMVVGGAAAAAGATILIVGAITDEPPAQEVGIDVGLGGVRGRAGQIDDGPGDLPALGGALLGGGALVHAIGIGLVLTASWDDDDEPRREPATAHVQPVVSPGFTGFRGTF